MSTFSYFSLRRALMGLAILFVATTVSAQDLDVRAPTAADGQLAWKFKQGQKLRMSMNQDVTMKMDMGVQKMEMGNGSINEMTLEVLSVDDKGVATVKNVIERMVVESDTPMGSFAFDSDSEDEPEGQAAQVAKALTPMIGAAVSQKMHPSGEITDVEIPSEVLDGIASGDPMIASMFNEDSLKELTSKASLVFPAETPKQGDSWEKTSEVSMGPATVSTETSYTYLGVTDLDGTPVHAIKGVVKMDFPDGIQGMDVDVVEEDSTVIFYFDGNLGRLVKSVLDQNMTMEISGPGGQVISQEMSQKTEMVVSEE